MCVCFAVDELCLKPKTLRDQRCRQPLLPRASCFSAQIFAPHGQHPPATTLPLPFCPTAPPPASHPTPPPYHADEPFTRKDLIHLQDPLNLSGRNLVGAELSFCVLLLFVWLGGVCATWWVLSCC